jgi:hypothetical protein
MPQIAASVFAIAFCLVALVLSLVRAPEGFENSDGFHYR